MKKIFVISSLVMVSYTLSATPDLRLHLPETNEQPSIPGTEVTRYVICPADELPGMDNATAEMNMKADVLVYEESSGNGSSEERLEYSPAGYEELSGAIIDSYLRNKQIGKNLGGVRLSLDGGWSYKFGDKVPGPRNGNTVKFRSGGNIGADLQYVFPNSRHALGLRYKYLTVNFKDVYGGRGGGGYEYRQHSHSFGLGYSCTVGPLHKKWNGFIDAGTGIMILSDRWLDRELYHGIDFGFGIQYKLNPSMVGFLKIGALMGYRIDSGNYGRGSDASVDGAVNLTLGLRFGKF